MNISKKRRLRIGPVGTAILGTIAITGVVVGIALFPGVTYAMAPFIKKRKREITIRKQSVEQNLSSLIAHGLVKMSHKNGDVTLSLTTKGKFEALLRHGRYRTEHKKWDGVWRIVIFDVSNKKEKLRSELRRAMQLYGFKMLQKSVWVYPYECDDFITILKSHLGVSQDVLYIKSHYIENQKYLKKEFGL